MPRGRPPGPPGTATDRNARVLPWTTATGSGWQHGEFPEAPRLVTSAAVVAWAAWLSSWWASFYEVEDLPGLWLLAQTYDQVMQGYMDVAKVIPLMDRYGITPKGRQDNRWLKDETAPAPAASESTTDEVASRRERRRGAIG